MKLHVVLFASSLLVGVPALFASKNQVVRVYEGIAKNTDGKVTYVEKHKTTFDASGNVLSAKTDYVKEDGTLLGRIDSDFTSNLTAPTHTFYDNRNGEEHGIRYEGDQIILFLKEKGKKEETKKIDKSIAGDGIIVGCQGLHYYLRQNFEKVMKKKVLPIKMLIPGKLDYYSFEMKLDKEKGDLVTFDIEIESFFLKFFAPSLQITYDKKSRNLLTYAGVSNILDDKGDVQNVRITYNYDAAQKQN